MAVYLPDIRHIRRNDEVKHKLCGEFIFLHTLSPFNPFTLTLFLLLFCCIVHSCIFLPGTVGVGSSGAVLGMLASWVVWIIFRW